MRWTKPVLWGCLVAGLTVGVPAAPGQTTVADPKEKELKQKEEELRRREEELARKEKELELKQREAELKRKEEALQRREALTTGSTSQPAAATAPASGPGEVPPGPPPGMVVPGMVPPGRGPGDARMLEMHARLVGEVSDEKVVEAMRRGADALLEELQKISDDPAVARPATVTRVVRGQVQVVAAPADPLTEAYEEGKLAMGAYALLMMHRALGEPKFHFASKEMAPIIKRVLELKTDKTYALAMQASALSLLPARPEFRKALGRVRDGLLANTRKDGSYGYTAPAAAARATGFGNGNWFDNSNTQYGLLGIWACDDAGVEIPNAYWRIADTWWRRTQELDGGWGYVPVLRSAGARGMMGGSSSTPTMAAAGVASLFVTMDKLDHGLHLDPVPDLPVQAGINWMVKDFERMRLMLGSDLYLAYGIERVGLASGYKSFGKYNWYREGAASVLGRQVKTGLWYYRGYGADPQGIVGTSYALLFLARGRNPVIFNKLQYKGPWDARPRDDANLTRWLTKRTERHLNWQIVDLDNSGADDWSDAPVLLITGHKDPKFSDADIAKLRQFVQAGGLIFSTADGNDAAFTDTIRRKVAPAMAFGQYEMRELPQDHYVYRLDYKVDKGKEPKLYGLSNGLRELWIHSPTDMGAAWQTYATAKKEMFEVPANIYFYVSGRASLRSRLQPLAVPAAKEPAKEKFVLGRAIYAGNADPEPYAWERFGKLAALRHQVEVTLKDVKLETLDVTQTPVVHLTGTTALTLNEKQKQSLGAFLRAGGVLLGDAAGGSEAFGNAFRQIVREVLPDTPFEALDAAHPVLTGKMGKGEALEEVELRRFALLAENRGRKLSVLEAKVGGKPAVLFFEGDITSGLLGSNTWGILGYTPKCAEALAWNALVYARGTHARGEAREEVDVATPPPPPAPLLRP